jgi:raffinose/stachyose/melibiose transport system permease protein
MDSKIFGNRRATAPSDQISGGERTTARMDSKNFSNRRTTRPARRNLARSVWWLILPAAALYVFAVIVPSVRGGLYAFTNWDGVSLNPKWVGLNEFRSIFNDPYGSTAVKNTLLIAFTVTIVQNVAGLLIALALNTRLKSRNLLRLIFFAPVVITSIAVGFLWQSLFAPTGGINVALKAAGLGALQQNWLGNPRTAIWSIMAVVSWQFVGYSMVIFLAGLQGIPVEILEAATVDGAGPFRRFRSIILPLLIPAVTINLMLSLIGGLKLFDQVLAMTQGGPGGSTNTISTLMYENAFQLGRFGYAAALAVLLTILVSVMAAIQYRLLARQRR